MGSGVKKKSVLGDVFTYGLSSVMARAITFFLLPLYTRFLSPAEYGLLDLISQIGLIINTIMMLNGFDVAVLTFYLQAKTEFQKKQVVSSLVLVMGIGVIVAAAMMIPFSEVIVRLFHLPLSSGLFAIGCATILAEIMPIVPFSLMQARLQSRRFMTWQVTSLFVRLLVTIFVVVVLHWGVMGILLVRAVTSFTVGLLLILTELKDSWSPPAKTVTAKIVRYIIPFVPAGLFFIVQGQGQRFFLLATAGPADLGLYAVGFSLTSVVVGLAVMPFHKVWNARMYAVYESENAHSRIGSVATKFSLLYLCGALPLVFFGELLLRVLSSADYKQASIVFIPLLLSGLIDTFTNIPDQVFLVHHKTKYKPYIAGAGAIVAVGIYAIFVPKYGILGAAYGVVVVTAIRAGIVLVLSRRIFPIKFEIRKLTQLLTLTFLIGYLGVQFPDSWAGVMAKICLLSIWASMIFWARIVPREDIQSVVHFLRSAIAALLLRIR